MNVQGWSGFHFVNLATPLETFRDSELYPASLQEIKIDGNTAHSTAFWWDQAAGFYFGGGLEYKDDNTLVYQGGRGPGRDPCLVREKVGDCGVGDFGWINVTNSKVFLLGGIGFVSVEVYTHAFVVPEALSYGFVFASCSAILVGQVQCEWFRGS